MEYIKISNKNVSRITLGTAQLGLNYGIANTQGKPNLEKSFEILDAALSGGITSIDTAQAYGNSEEIIGKYSRERNIRFPFITTKYKSQLPQGSSRLEIEYELLAYLDAARQRLNTDKLDCLLLHSASDMTRFGSAIADSLEKAVLNGAVDKVGVSVYGEQDILSMLNYGVYTAVQLPINIFDRQLYKKGIINKLKEQKITVFARSIFFQGLFFLQPKDIADSKLHNAAAGYISILNQIAEQEGIAVAQLAAAYVRDMPGISSIVLGADNAQQISQNIEYVTAPVLSKSVNKAIDKHLSDIDIDAIRVALAEDAAKKA